MDKRPIALAAGAALLLAVALLACAQAPDTSGHRPDIRSQVADQPIATGSHDWMERYPWLDTMGIQPSSLTPLEARFPTPPDCKREHQEPGSFGRWLRGLPIRLDRQRVLTHSGARTWASASAVVALDLGNGDLQQCADCLIRLHAEHLWSQGAAQGAAYHFTSGHLSTWTAWTKGERVSVRGSRVLTSTGAPRPATHASYRTWLQHLFIYAGTLSLDRDTREIPENEPIAAGDLFVDPGSPGHAVMVLDIIEDRNGDRLGLIGQGYTPAQDFHVLQDPGLATLEGVWFRLPRDRAESLEVPSWSPFPRSTARRFESRPPQG